MAGRSVTLELPEALYDRLQRRAVAARRSLGDEVVLVLATAAPGDDERLPAELEDELARVEAPADASLWRLAQERLPARTAKRMQALQFKRQLEGLSGDERRLEVALAAEYDRHMVVRSKALLLLKQRGHDIGEPVSPP